MMLTIILSCAPPIGYALSFTDSSADSAGCDPSSSASEELTVEAWVAWDGGERGAVVGSMPGFLLWADQNAEFYVDGPSTYSTSDELSDGGFHHLAGTWNSAEIALFVDGVATASLPVTRAEPAEYWQVQIGGIQLASDWFPTFSGTIDEVRISDTVRYDRSFAPPSSPFVADANTLLLLHLDEGEGQWLHESAHDIECWRSGGTWVERRW